MHSMRKLLAALALAALPGTGAVIYNNPASGLPDTVMFGAGSYLWIGDEIQLTGTQRVGTQATVQFFNAGVSGAFEAVLQFWQIGAPVGAPLGSELVVAAVAPEMADFTVTIPLLALQLPNNGVAFTLGVRNVASGADLGVNLYGGALPGSIIVNTGSFGTLSGVNASDLFFLLEASERGPGSPVPEPGAMGPLALALACALWFGSRRHAKLE